MCLDLFVAFKKSKILLNFGLMDFGLMDFGLMDK